MHLFREKRQHDLKRLGDFWAIQSCGWPLRRVVGKYIECVIETFKAVQLVHDPLTFEDGCHAL